MSLPLIVDRKTTPMRRRTVLSSLTALTAAALVLAGCGADAKDDASSAGGAWSYTAGDGKTYTADKTPTRIIAHAYAAKALMEFGIKPVGIYADGKVAEDVGLQGVDFTGIEILGEEWGKIDAEKAVTLAPDLIVADWWPAEGVYSGQEEGVEDSAKKLSELADVVGPAQGDSIVGVIEGYATLAKSLGADAAAIDSAKATFDEAVARFQAATAAKPNLTALAISPYDDVYAVAVPKYAPELLDFQKWGLKVIDPETPDPEFPYWESLSFENADKYQPDVLLFDDRNAPGGQEKLASQPIAANIKAYAAGAMTNWPAYWLHTYTDYTAQLDKLTTFIESADENTGE
ncbi:ABC transporter substrate-binding protein [Phytomonospora endophytica]|uniref:Iron complex transport system substrate-binding protein n=1 Tax=Phytomonospora endophytica TaxID=714109 RepID=A0A841FA93_9ACTN|nr:ABC transporter substrate-binding protein [Phytomonospora endophytica]MBB6034171.1 iron complex transport system substrate-binding protein [Phytomonospora endophytica]